MANTTWATTQNWVTLSGGNLILTSYWLGFGSAWSEDYHNSGKYYFEITFTTTTDTYTCAGIRGFYGDLRIVLSDGYIWANGAPTSINIGAMSSGDVLGIAVDLDNKRIWFRKGAAGNWNGNATYSPDTNVGGFPITNDFYSPYGQTNVAANVLTLNSGDSAFTGTVPTGFTSGWTVGPSTDAFVNLIPAETWVNFNTVVSPGRVTTSLLEAWVTNDSKPTEGQVSSCFTEVWTARNSSITNANATNVVVEIWFQVGSERPPIPPGTIYCATVPQDATGDAGSPGTGMTDQLNGSFTPDNAPVDATGDITNDPPLVFQFSTETLACITAPTNADGHDAGSTGTGITSLLVDTITPDVQPINATGDIITSNAGVSGQVTSMINCTTSPANATGDAGSSGTGVTDQLSDPLICNVQPTDASGGTGVPPDSYSTQIP